jgi:hypothetical protein
MFLESLFVWRHFDLTTQHRRTGCRWDNKKFEIVLLGAQVVVAARWLPIDQRFWQLSYRHELSIPSDMGTLRGG